MEVWETRKGGKSRSPKFGKGWVAGDGLFMERGRLGEKFEGKTQEERHGSQPSGQREVWLDAGCGVVGV